MIVPLREAASFLCNHEWFVSRLWQHRDEAWTDADLLGFAENVSNENSPSPKHLVAELKKHRFIVERIEPSATWELAPAFQGWIEHLNMTARPVRSEVIDGFILALETALKEFSRAWPAPDSWASAREALQDIWQQLRKTIENLAATQLAITNEVSEIKTSRVSLSATERFRRINRLWKTYLLPMLDLLDTGKKFPALCDHIEQELALALSKHALPERRVAIRITDEIRTLRHSILDGFRAAHSEIRPLHERLRRESEWTQGAARILQHFTRERDFPQQLAARLAIPNFRLRTNLTDAVLKRCAAQWQNYQPNKIAAIDFGSTADMTRKRQAHQVFDRCIKLPPKRFPIPDFVAFLAKEFPDEDFYTLLRTLSLVLNDTRRVDSDFHLPRSEYNIGCGTLCLARVSVNLRKHSQHRPRNP
ncbi:MAG: hypothetical protein LBC18_04400 [Opitutaceae bacterium]|jgi:hypothetical protein|nr:hypothetical protein [Opitutaceae bacterium]